MKKIYTLLAALLMSTLLMGQSPSSFKYQAVLRNLRGDIRANADATILIEITKNQGNGEVIYSETHKVKTDNFGLIDLEIGKGTPVIGDFSTIDWSNGTYFVKISVDGLLMGTSQLHSVPYALYAEKAGNGFSGSYNDLTDKPTFSTVAFTGDYNDLITAPTLAEVATSGSYNDLLDKPTIPTQYTDAMADARVVAGITGKVDKETGKGLSTNDYTTVEKTKLSGIASGAEVNVNADWNASTGDALILNKPILAVVATSGGYEDLLNKPLLFDGTWTSLTGKPTFAVVATSGIYNDLLEKPTIPTQYTDAMADGRVVAGITGKVDKETGKGLSTNDFSTAEKNKLDGIATGAEVNVNSDWTATTGDALILNKPVLASVATSGNYTDLSGTPITDGSETKITSGTNISISGTGTQVSPYILNSQVSGFTHYLGEVKDGGIIFYIYKGSDGQEHGLIVALTESVKILQNSGTVINAYRTWDGAYNTALYDETSDAKTYVESLGSGWYIPALDEMSLLWHNRYHVNKALAEYGAGAKLLAMPISGFPSAEYWTSTDYNDSSNGWLINFTDFSLTLRGKSSPYIVRAIRSF